MNKKIYRFTFLLVGISLMFASCLGTDEGTKIDEDWKRLNEQRYAQVANDAQYKVISSASGNGKVYWKLSSVITDSDKELRITTGGTPEFTDTVKVRYEGWYLDRDGKKVIFDSTENPTSFSNLQDPERYPNKTPKKFAVSGVVDGWTTMLQYMRVNDEREVCIPQQLAYGASGQASDGIVIIPAFTTLFFRVKLLEIIPMKGLKN